MKVFDSIEDLKWFYHKKLCRNSSDKTAAYLMDALGKVADAVEANKLLETFKEPYRVKECR